MNNKYQVSIYNIAKRLRQNMTPAEKVLWALLRDNQFGVKFRRQTPFIFGNYRYVADFCSLRHKLIIEVDGGIHNDPEVKEMDEFREEVFVDAGYRVFRFTNNEVLYQTSKVIARIKHVIEEL